MHTIGNKFLGGFVNGYKITTLENNVDEDRFDQKYLKEHKPIASDVINFNLAELIKLILIFFFKFSGYYETTYDEAAKAVTESNELGKQHIFTKGIARFFNL